MGLNILPQTAHNTNKHAGDVSSPITSESGAIKKPEPDPIHVSHQDVEPAVATPFAPAIFMISGVLMPVILALMLLVKVLRLPLAPMAITIATVGVAVGLWYGIRAWHRSVAGWKRARDATRSDPSFRIRVIGEGADTSRLVADLPDVPFEPVVGFAWFAAAYVSDQRASSATSSDPKQSPLKALSEMTHPQKWLIACLTIIFIVAIFTAQWHILGSRQAFGPLQFWAGFGLASIAAAFLTPTYVRVAPGSLDILRFGWRPKGLPAYEHWDLRECRVLVDTRLKRARITGPGIGPRRDVVISLFQIAGGQRTVARAILRAARTRHPTPPLPTDALVG